MSRSRNSEIYVKGYGKSITKEDLKKWFKPFGKINCIQYKGPYSFIVINMSLISNTLTIWMLNMQSNRCMTKK
jgi:RNA recognition motif-containing protein